MRRVIAPLATMGAAIVSEPGDGRAPLRIEGRSLHGAEHVAGGVPGVGAVLVAGPAVGGAGGSVALDPRAGNSSMPATSQRPSVTIRRSGYCIGTVEKARQQVAPVKG